MYSLAWAEVPKKAGIHSSGATINISSCGGQWQYSGENIKRKTTCNRVTQTFFLIRLDRTFCPSTENVGNELKYVNKNAAKLNDPTHPSLDQFGTRTHKATTLNIYKKVR